MDHTDSWSNKVTTNRTRHWAIALQYLIPLVAAVPTLYFKPGLASLTPLLTGVSVFTALLFGLLGIIFNAGVTLRKDGDSCGCSTLTAATILGEIADVRRFRSRHAFARHNGTAPLPVWSSNHARHRLSRTGNRQLNTPRSTASRSLRPDITNRPASCSSAAATAARTRPSRSGSSNAGSPTSSTKRYAPMHAPARRPD